MSELLVIEPVFAQRLWGGTALRRIFGSEVPEGLIGECWAVSGMPGMSGRVRCAGPADGLTLREAWRAGHVTGAPRDDDLPILCKFLDPQDWLSVQVHPDDGQAAELEGQPWGKAECWLVIHADPGAELIIGHRAGSRQELRAALDAGQLSAELLHHSVAADDFFLISAGVVHSLGPGVLVYEVQQSSDTTYRLYDFDRVGLDGRPRELHLDKAFSVVTAPYDPSKVLTAAPWTELPDGTRTRVLVDRPEFRVTRWDARGSSFTVSSPGYQILTVIGGGGELASPGGSVPVGMGTSVVIPAGMGPVTATGSFRAVVTRPGGS